jgi:uncharacterized protein (DUF433 family)
MKWGRTSFVDNKMENLLTQYIAKTQGVCGGRACITGHRVRVMDIVGWHERRGLTVAQIVEMFQGITRADVHAALAHYYDNPDEIDNDFRLDEQWAQWAEQNLPSLIPAGLKEKLGG